MKNYFTKAFGEFPANFFQLQCFPWFRVICMFFVDAEGKGGSLSVNTAEKLQPRSQKTVLVHMHICSIHILVLLRKNVAQARRQGF